MSSASKGTPTKVPFSPSIGQCGLFITVVRIATAVIRVAHDVLTPSHRPPTPARLCVPPSLSILTPRIRATPDRANVAPFCPYGGEKIPQTA